MKTLKVTLNDDTVEIYEDVIRAYTGNHLNGEDDLRIKMWWSGEQTASHSIPLSQIKKYEFIKDDNSEI